MKKIISAILALALCTCFMCSCKKEDKEVEVSTDFVEDNSTPELTPEMIEAMQPQEIQIRNICQLATLEVYFHNVAKAVKPADVGIMGFNQTDRRFWVEYSGTATVGIDMNRVTMSIEDNVITVKIPHAKLLGNINVDSSSYDVNSVVTESEEWWRRSNEITADDVTTAIREANIYTQLAVLNNRSMMANAENRATQLIRNYIQQISKYSEVEYEIRFEYLDDLET